jgi:DNA-binding GntR family transcriptional regulator
VRVSGTFRAPADVVYYEYTMMAQHGSLRDRAYRYLQGKMLSGELAPGARISEEALAAELGISRTPMREAVKQLAHEGLLEAVPRVGTIVRKPDRREIEELYELREALEGYAVERAAARAGREDLEALQRFHDEIGAVAGELKAGGKRALEGALLRRFLAADLGFHLRLLEAAGNRRMVKAAAESRVLGGIFGTRRQEHTAEVVTEAWRFHHRILSAVRRSDGRLARKLVVEHIRTSKREALDHFERRTRARAGTSGIPEELRKELERIERG